MNNFVKYYSNDDEYYKVNSDLKRITKISNNEVTYLEYNDDIVNLIKSYKKRKMAEFLYLSKTAFFANPCGNDLVENNN